MLRQLSTPAIEATAVGLLVLVCLAFAAFDVPILNGDEARFAQASREMFLDQEWVVPTFGGQPRYDKPILIYWATVASFQMFGVTPFAARLPSAVAGALCAALLAWSARRRWGPGSGLAAGLCLGASPIFFFEGQACTADSLNLLCTLAAMLALEQLLIGRATRGAAAIFWIGTATAVLTKGPVAPLFIVSTLVGIWALARTWKNWESLLAGGFLLAGSITLGPIVLIIPALIAVVAALAGTESRQVIFAFRWLWGIPLFLLISLPWAIKAWQVTGGEFFLVAVGRHILDRGQSALEGHSGFPGFYIVTAVVLCFPWLAVAVSAGRNAWRQRRNASGLLFLLAWAIGPLLTLETVQTKLVHYWLPSYPALILLAVGSLWTVGEGQLPQKALSRALVAVHIIGGCFLAVIPVIVVLKFYLPGLLVFAVSLTGFLLTTTGISIKSRTRAKGPLLVGACGSLIFLAVLLGPFLSRLSESFVGSRATETAIGLLDQGHTVGLFGLRDEEMLFSLPADTKVHRTRKAIQAAAKQNGKTIFCARERDFLREFGTANQNRFEVIDTVNGLDLGRGRYDTTVFFRLETEP